MPTYTTHTCITHLLYTFLRPLHATLHVCIYIYIIINIIYIYIYIYMHTCKMHNIHPPHPHLPTNTHPQIHPNHTHTRRHAHMHTHHNHSTSQHTAPAVHVLEPTFPSSLMTTERLNSPDWSNTEYCITIERRGKCVVAIQL